MPRADAIVPPEAIRIEDEVWQEAFTRREPARTNRRRRLEAIDGGLPDWLDETQRSAPPIERPSSERRVRQPITYAGSTASRPRSAPVVGEGISAPIRTDVASPARRTVKIQGRGAERPLPVPDPSRRRPQRRVYERSGFRPDRVAMWAVLLGLLLVMVAVASGHG